MTDAPEPTSTAASTAPPRPQMLDRRSALIGTALGLVAGVAIGLAAMLPMRSEAAASPAAAAAPGAPAHDAGPSAFHPPEPTTPSYAQQGEDLVMLQMLAARGVRQPSYLDIGVHDPIANSKTYWFYKLGGRGVLVEPDPARAKRLQAVRSRDAVLDVGISARDEREADYFVIDGNIELNTFSKKAADDLVRVRHRKVERTLKRKVMKLGEVLEANFKDGSPHVMTLDTPGLELDILQTVDWKRWRPLIVCVHSADLVTGKVDRGIVEWMEKNGYVVRGGSFVNTIFLDEQADADAQTPDASAPPEP